MKKYLFLILNIFLTVLVSKAQNKEYSLLIISIEKKTNTSVHQFEKDYWVIPKWKIESVLRESVLPFFIDGYSGTDLIECCQENSLVLFNYSKTEDFTANSNLEVLDSIIKRHRKKIQVARKKWTNGIKEKIEVYITPIKGKFCFCGILDGRDDTNSKIGYKGDVIVPVSDFSYDAQFWNSPLDQQIARFDYLNLPFLQLHLIQ